MAHFLFRALFFLKNSIYLFQMQSGKKWVGSDDDDIRRWLLGHLHTIQAKALAANFALPRIYDEKIKVLSFAQI